MPDLPYIKESLRALARPVAELLPMTRNPRSHDERSIDAIRASIRRFGQVKPIVLGDPDGDGSRQIIAGNGTFEAMRREGFTHIAVVESGLSGQEALAFAIADNATTDLSVFDEDIVGDIMAGLDDPLSDLLEDMGLDFPDLTDAMSAAAAESVTQTIQPSLSERAREANKQEIPDGNGARWSQVDGSAPDAPEENDEHDPNSDATKRFATLVNQTTEGDRGDEQRTARPDSSNFLNLIITGPASDIVRVRTKLNEVRAERGLSSNVETLLALLGLSTQDETASE